jgi:phosphatidylcholine synthase
VVIVVTGALYMADRRMKTGDNYFRGFPAVWNVIAFYLFLLRPDAYVAAGAIGLLAIMTFVPVPFIHPLRVARLRPLNLVLLSTWSVLALVAVARDLKPGLWVNLCLITLGVYFLLAGFSRRAAAP